MRKPSRLDYAYAVGRVRALERNLVSSAVFREAAGEKDFFSALKIIFDTGNFLDEMTDIKNSEELDFFLDNEQRNLFHLMSKILLEKDMLEISTQHDEPQVALAIAQNTGYFFIVDYFRHKIDLGNLKIFSRVKYLGLSAEKFDSAFLSGGILEKRIFLQSFDLSLVEFGEMLRASPYRAIWLKAVDTLIEKDTFIELERCFEDFLMIYLRKAKYIVFGPEPVFAYMLARKRELSLVRLLGVGKLNLVPPEVLKHRISETYV